MTRNIDIKTKVIFITAVCISSIGIGVLCYENKYELSVILKPSVDRIDLDDEANNIPLPQNTTFAFRTAQDSAVYYTTSSLDEILLYYQNLDDRVYKNIENLDSYGDWQVINEFTLSNDTKTYRCSILKSLENEGLFMGIGGETENN